MSRNTITPANDRASEPLFTKSEEYQNLTCFREASANGQSENPLWDLFVNHYDHPGDLRQFDTVGRRKRVAVIGGGAAGLASAFELIMLGHEVTLMEAGSRPGGRIKTARFDDESYADLGAMRIPSNHLLTLHYIELHDLKPYLRPFRNTNPQGFLRFRGETTRIGNAISLCENLNLKKGEFVDPYEHMENLMKDAMLKLPEEVRESYFSPELIGPLADLGRCTLSMYLDGLGLSRDSIDYMLHSTGMQQYRNAAMSETLLDYFGLYRAEQYRLDGGMDLLVSAFVDRIGDRLMTNTRVNRIKSLQDGILVEYCHENMICRQKFDYVIVTVPAPAIAKIDFEPVLPPVQADAFRSVSYASSAKTILHCDHGFWMDEGIEDGGASFTDGQIQQVWYPNGKLEPNQGCALTGSYTWEQNARFMGAMNEHERAQFVVKELGEIHPGCENHIDGYQHVVWDQQVGVGAFAYFAPGDHNKYQPYMEMPYPEKQPRLWFAGEHLSVAHAWIQGALQTGVEATINVLRAPCRS